MPLNRNSLENGIFVHAPIELTVNIDGKSTVVRGETLEPYKPQLIHAVEARYQDKADVNNAMIAGFYADEAKNASGTTLRAAEDVAASLKNMVLEKDHGAAA